jgi:RNA polymerase subunit RPABC4/transcription elongation factor Spt4
MAKCQHCDAPNPEGYFNCPECGERASKPKWTPQFVVRENSPWATAIRKDQIDFNEISMDDHIKRSQEKKAKEKKELYNKAIKWDK